MKTKEMKRIRAQIFSNIVFYWDNVNTIFRNKAHLKKCRCLLGRHLSNFCKVMRACIVIMTKERGKRHLRAVSRKAKKGFCFELDDFNENQEISKSYFKPS